MDNQNKTPAEDGNLNGRKKEGSNQPRNYKISPKGRASFVISGSAYHSFDLVQITDYCYTSYDGTLVFYGAGAKRHRVTGELAAVLYAALIEWHERGGDAP